MNNQRDITIYSNRGEKRPVSGVNLETERVNPALIKKKSPLKWIIIVGISVLLISGNTQDNTQDNDMIEIMLRKAKN